MKERISKLGDSYGVLTRIRMKRMLAAQTQIGIDGAVRTWQYSTWLITPSLWRSFR